MKSNYRVFRGGGWRFDGATDLAARARYRIAPSNRDYSLGFRCVIFQSGANDRVYRGVSWLDFVAAYLAARARLRRAPSSRVIFLGFRCVNRRRQ